MHPTLRRGSLSLALWCVACGGGGGGGGDDQPAFDAAPLPAPTCAPADGGGSRTVAVPTLSATLFDRWHEGWLASPAVADLDGDGVAEIIAPRHELLLVWNVAAGASSGTEKWRASMPERIWASPVVADLVPGRPGLEVAVASDGQVAVFDAAGAMAPGFPVTWQSELRTLAAGDLDGDGDLELVAVTTSPLEGGGQRDIVIAWRGDGTVVPGFPPNTTGAAGCTDACYVTGGYDQNLAIGDVTGDLAAEIFATQDNAYLSLHGGDGRAFDAAAIFDGRDKFSGIRGMVDYRLAQQGYADDEAIDEQGHYTNTAPAIADLDGDGVGELIALGSVQNAAQSDRERGVALWVLRPDGTRPPAWEAPPRFPDYLSGLWDYGNNVVAITNQVTVAEINGDQPGPELLFAGFDGRIHAVSSMAQPLWAAPYTSSTTTGTGGIVVGDLSGDGIPELVLATYGEGGGELLVFDAAGNRLHAVPLPGRGAMPVPTLADADGDGTVDIVVSLKDGEDRVRQVLVFRVDGARANCLLWPTGRGSLRRDGYLPPAR